MKKTILTLLVVILLTSFAASLAFANVGPPGGLPNGNQGGGSGGNQGWKFECQNFFDDPNYFPIEKWGYNESDGTYFIDETNELYKYYTITVDGDSNEADWTSNYYIEVVLVKSGPNTFEFAGGSSGTVNSTQDISHITFCGFWYNDGKGGNGGGHGVPEFSTIGLLAAVLSVSLGIVLMRKH